MCWVYKAIKTTVRLRILKEDAKEENAFSLSEQRQQWLPTDTEFVAKIQDISPKCPAIENNWLSNSQPAESMSVNDENPNIPLNFKYHAPRSNVNHRVRCCPISIKLVFLDCPWQIIRSRLPPIF